MRQNNELPLAMREPSTEDVLHDNWDRAPWNRWTFQHVRQLVPTVQVWRGPGPVTPLPAEHQDLGSISFEANGHRQTIDAFLQSSYTDGFLVLHRGHVVTERYFNGMTARTPHLSQSVAKSRRYSHTRGQLDPTAPLTNRSYRSPATEAPPFNTCST